MEDVDILSLPIEELGEYLMQTEIGDRQNCFMLSYIDDDENLHLRSAESRDVSMSLQDSIDKDLPSCVEDFGSPLLRTIEELYGGAEDQFPMLDSGDAHDKSTFVETIRAECGAGLPTAETTKSTAKPNIAGTSPSGSPEVQAMEGCSAKICFPITSTLVKKLESTGSSNNLFSAPAWCLEEERGFRKKSREKLRRKEINFKFEELISILGQSPRSCKSHVLQDAISSIRSLRRERDDLRRCRDRQQLEINRLSACLEQARFEFASSAMSQYPAHSLPTNLYHSKYSNDQTDLVSVNSQPPTSQDRDTCILAPISEVNSTASSFQLAGTDI